MGQDGVFLGLGQLVLIALVECRLKNSCLKEMGTQWRRKDKRKDEPRLLGSLVICIIVIICGGFCVFLSPLLQFNLLHLSTRISSVI